MHLSLKLLPTLLAILTALLAYYYSIIDFRPNRILNQLQFTSVETTAPIKQQSALTTDMSASRQVIKKVFAVETPEVCTVSNDCESERNRNRPIAALRVLEHLCEGPLARWVSETSLRAFFSYCQRLFSNH